MLRSLFGFRAYQNHTPPSGRYLFWVAAWERSDNVASPRSTLSPVAEPRFPHDPSACKVERDRGSRSTPYQLQRSGLDVALAVRPMICRLRTAATFGILHLGIFTRVIRLLRQTGIVS
jgi:hypothetical protein